MAQTGDKEVPAAVKKSVRAVLLSKIDGVLLSKFPRDYRSLLEEPVPYAAHGFTSVMEFLRAMPDVVRFDYSNLNKDWRLYGIGDPNSYMSAHAKKAQGKPGQDVDKLDMPRKRHRNQSKGHHGCGVSHGVGLSGGGVTPNRQRVEEGGDQMLIAGHKGLYSLCCQLMKNHQEDILKDFESVATVVESSLFKSYLFTRYSTRDDALRIINTFKAKYSVRPAMHKIRQKREREQLSAVMGQSHRPGVEQAKTSSQAEGSIVDGVEIYIGNIPKTWTEANILFLLEGLLVTDLRIKSKGESKRFAFGTLSSDDAIVAVKKLNGMHVDNRSIICRLAHPDPEKAGPEQAVPRVRVESVQSLVKMGFPLEGSRRAVYFSGNKGVEAAVTWITQHQNDPEFNQPFTIPINTREHIRGSGDGPFSSKSQGSDFRPSPKGLDILMSQGVSKERAIMALTASNNRVVAAEAWLFQHDEEQAADSPVAQRSSEGETSEGSTEEGLPARVSTQSPGFYPDQEAMSTLLALGLPRERVLKALEASNNNVEEASEWIIQNTTELQAALNNLLKGSQSTNATNSPENVTETNTSTADTEAGAKSNNTGLAPILPTSGGAIYENGTHVSKETGCPQTHGDVEDSEDDMPSLEDDDEEIPELEYDTDDGLSNDSNSVSTESDTQRVSIFVGNFPYGTTQVELLEIFSEYQPSKITMISNNQPFKTTYAFLVLPNMDLAEAAIEEMSGELYEGRVLLVGMAFIDRGYNDPPDEEEPENKEYSAETESSVGGLPDSVQLFDSLMKTLWPDCRLLEHGIYGRLVVSVTSVVNDHFFYGHVTDFEKEMFFLSDLNKELNQVCRRRLPEKKIPMHRCAALFEGNWYRAYNMGQFGQGQQQAVLFVDYGNIEPLPARKLRRPDPRFWEAPAVAKLFRLFVGSLADHPNIEGSTIKIATIPKKDGEEVNSITQVKILEIL